MRRSRPLDFCRDLCPSPSASTAEESGDTEQLIQPLVPANPPLNRLCLLPAYPTFDRFGPVNRDHLLLANVPRRELTSEQQRRRTYHEFHQPFTLIDQSAHISVRPFFVYLYQELYEHLSQRCHLDNAILDYNYERLRQCLNIVIHERIRHGLSSPTIASSEQLRIDEYALAMEFYLQMDDELFFMKTCRFRHAQPSLYNDQGIFCIDPPQAHYGMVPCENVTCRFCFPISDIVTRGRQGQPVVRFSAAQKHRFVNGYEAILNCPTSCTTRHILYTLLCPCGHYDYIGYTAMSLSEQLAGHREQGNRIIHEFILGMGNADRMRQRPKSSEEVKADAALLYRHSARCSAAIQMFLDCNPQYWCLVPMPVIEAQTQNLSAGLPADSTIFDSRSTSLHSGQTRRDQEASIFMHHLPPVPSENYTFSAWQRSKQLQTFKDKRDALTPNIHLDLYDAAIITVLPEGCTELFYLLIEALFITHAQTKLNTLGHLDGMVVANNNSNDIDARLVDERRGDWCANLVRRPVMAQEKRTFSSHRSNPHFQ